MIAVTPSEPRQKACDKIKYDPGYYNHVIDCHKSYHNEAAHSQTYARNAQNTQKIDIYCYCLFVSYPRGVFLVYKVLHNGVNMYLFVVIREIPYRCVCGSVWSVDVFGFCRTQSPHGNGRKEKL